MKRILFSLLFILSISAQGYSEWSGNIKFDYRGFTKKGLYPNQEQHFLSFAFEPTFYAEWADGDQTLNFTGFARYDQHDQERTHGDIRELYWTYISDTWELHVGLKKIFWGVIETYHLVDIINQTDFVESFDGEQKLGQPMVHFSYPADMGTLDLFVMPFFRQRKFPAAEGRLRFPASINTSKTVYESSEGKKRVDLAARYSHTIGLLDFGIGHFYGTNRLPSFIFNAGSLIPFYNIINQTSLDAQLTSDDFLYKLEAIYQSSNQIDYAAFSGGLEYTFGNISNTGLDIGVLLEYHYDDRSKDQAFFFDNDLFIGSRLAFNDEQSLEILFGSAIDIDNGSHLFSIEAARRFGDSWKVNLELRAFTNIATQDLLNTFRDDSFFQFTLAKYF